jgi:hypothetical protein
MNTFDETNYSSSTQNYSLVNITTVSMRAATTTENWVWIDLQMFPIYLYISPTIGIIGVLLSILCFIILSDSEFKETLYKYLKVETIFIGVNLFLTCFRPFHYNKVDWSSKTHFSYFYLIYGLYYFASTLEMAAVITQICSTLDFYLFISNYHQKCKVFGVLAYYKIVTFVIFVVSGLLYVYQFFDKTLTGYLVAFQENDNVTIKLLYRDESTEFDKTLAKKVLEMGVFLLRDLLLLGILIFLNVLIYLRVKQTMKNKKSVLKYMLNNREETATQIDANIQNKSDLTKSAKNRTNNIQKTQNKTTLMVIFNGLNYIFGRTPILIYFILINIGIRTDGVYLYNQFAVLAVYISYTIKFFFYYYSNNKFRKIFKKYCRKLFFLFKYK